MTYHYGEIKQRRLNIERQSSEITTLLEDIYRIEKDIKHEKSKRMPVDSGPDIKKKACFYCGDLIPQTAKVCPLCKRVFLDHAKEVFEAELRLIRSSKPGWK